MARSGPRVFAPGSTVVSTVGAMGNGERSLIDIARSLEAAEERLAALASYTPHAKPHVQKLRGIRLLLAALMAHAPGGVMRARF